jgi:hypothetical protein
MARLTEFHRQQGVEALVIYRGENMKGANNTALDDRPGIAIKATREHVRPGALSTGSSLTTAQISSSVNRRPRLDKSLRWNPGPRNQGDPL